LRFLRLVSGTLAVGIGIAGTETGLDGGEAVAGDASSATMTSSGSGSPRSRPSSLSNSAALRCGCASEGSWDLCWGSLGFLFFFFMTEVMTARSTHAKKITKKAMVSRNSPMTSLDLD